MGKVELVYPYTSEPLYTALYKLLTIPFPKQADHVRGHDQRRRKNRFSVASAAGKGKVPAVFERASIPGIVPVV